jgi:hypothetical protein
MALMSSMIQTEATARLEDGKQKLQVLVCVPAHVGVVPRIVAT